jgi:hypothetical protein
VSAGTRTRDLNRVRQRAGLPQSPRHRMRFCIGEGGSSARSGTCTASPRGVDRKSSDPAMGTLVQRYTGRVGRNSRPARMRPDQSLTSLATYMLPRANRRWCDCVNLLKYCAILLNALCFSANPEGEVETAKPSG